MIIKPKHIEQIIRSRRSIYPVHFDPSRKIDNQVVQDILKLAVWAPSHGLTQPWSFSVFCGEGLKTFFLKLKDIYKQITPPEQLKESKLAKYDEKIAQVSHVIAVCMIRDPNRKYPAVEEIVAAACVIQNIYLCLDAFGIAGYLSTGDVCYTQEIKDFLRLGPEDQCLGFFQLGIPKKDLKIPLRKRIAASEKTVWINR
jgi:nitroreductase